MPAVDERLVRRAADGDRYALEAVVRAVQDDLYRLALRMLWHPADAEDATQEILVRLVTRLDAFRGEAAFTTWAYRVAVNHLLTTRRRRAERAALSFDEFAADLAGGRDRAYAAPGVDDALLEEEVKVGCTQAMLLCLDRGHRAAYIVGEVFDLPSGDAAWILDLTPAAYRKRLSRARERIRAFMEGQCGLVRPENPCRCRRRIGTAIATGRVDPDHLLFARTGGAVRRGIAEMEGLHASAAVFRSHPETRAPDALARRVLDILADDRLSLLDDRCSERGNAPIDSA
jgi:RNA polymerase sigma factor (sigma-70 family)